MSDENKIPVPDEVAAAIRTLITWSGDDPDREGLIDTPKRVARAWKEYCAGYEEDPGLHLLCNYAPRGFFPFPCVF